MVTSISFFHVRNLKWLLKIARRKLRGLRIAILAEQGKYDRLAEAQDKGHIEDAQKAIMELLELFHTEEEDIINVEETEMTVLHDELQDEAKDYKELLKVLKEAQAIDPGMASEIEKIEHHFHDTLAVEGKEMKIIIKESLDMFRDRSARLHFASLTTNHFTSGEAIREITREISEIKHLQKDESELHHLIKELEAYVERKEPEKIKDVVGKVAQAIEQEMKDSEILIKTVHTVLHALNIVTIHYLNSIIEDENPQSIAHKFAELIKEGYPKDHLEAPERKHEEDRKKSFEDFKHMFELARYMGYEIQAQDGQAG